MKKAIVCCYVMKLLGQIANLCAYCETICEPFLSLDVLFLTLSLVKYYLTLHHGRREQVLCCEHGYEVRLSLGKTCD